MDRQTLKQIIFQSRHATKQHRSAYKKSQLSYIKNGPQPSKLSSICLLGSLQMRQPPPIVQAPSIKKFQIVQLKKYNPKTVKKETNKYDNALKAQLKNRQIRSHRDSFKVDRMQQSQLGIFQKSLGIKFIQKPSYFIQGEMITNKTNSQAHKLQLLSKIEHQSSSLNIESLPQKFIPSEILGVKEYKRIYHEERRKIIQQTNQAIKRSLFAQFKSLNYNSSDPKQNDRIDPQKFVTTQMSSQLFAEKGKQFTDTHRANSMTGVPKKNLLKKIYEQHKQFQDKIEQQKREVLQIRKQVNKNYAKPFNPPQNITAQSYILYEVTKKQSKYRRSFQINEKRRFINSHKIMVQFNSRTPVQIASLTKIMTFIVALEICQKYNKSAERQIVKIGLFQQNISGTTANLVKGQTYTLEQLLYGLMLPSGNDASLAIAVWGGRVLCQNKDSKQQLQKSLIKRKRIFYERFLEEMNKKAAQLGMEKTHYANSHGLMNVDNKSCAFDLALLCEYAMRKEKFRQVVQTKSYQCFISSQKQQCETISSPTLTNRSSSFNRNSSLNNIQNEYIQESKDLYADDLKNESIPIEQFKLVQIQQAQVELINSGKQIKAFTKKIYWQNTHNLVRDKSSLYKGIKTGITDAAGPCLSSFIQFNGRQFIIIVLNCKTMKQRFRDTQNLRKWAFQKQQIQFNQ